MNSRRSSLVKRLIVLALAFGTLTAGLWFLFGRPSRPADEATTVRVMAYSSFLNAWGPGPEIAKRFREETGLTVNYHDAGDAGLIIEKMKLFSVDAVVGLDRLSLEDARAKQKWRGLVAVEGEPTTYIEPEFLPFDYAPLTFVYREGEISPPRSLDDLLDQRFKGGIAFEDPRTSAPGLQFFYWVLDEKGIDAGFEYFEKLKNSVHSVSAGWSAAYGAFTKNHAWLAFSYLTSPVYHWVEEKDKRYRAAVFETGHPVQVEYAAVPMTCRRCDDAEKFIRFLRRNDIQAIIMKKNFMMPVKSSVTAGTDFAALPEVKVREYKTLPELVSRRSELFERWRKLGM